MAKQAEVITSPSLLAGAALHWASSRGTRGPATSRRRPPHVTHASRRATCRPSARRWCGAAATSPADDRQWDTSCDRFAHPRAAVAGPIGHAVELRLGRDRFALVGSPERRRVAYRVRFERGGRSRGASAWVSGAGSDARSGRPCASRGRLTLRSRGCRPQPEGGGTGGATPQILDAASLRSSHSGDMMCYAINPILPEHRRPGASVGGNVSTERVGARRAGARRPPRAAFQYNLEDEHVRRGRRRRSELSRSGTTTRRTQPGGPARRARRRRRATRVERDADDSYRAGPARATAEWTPRRAGPVQPRDHHGPLLRRDRCSTARSFRHDLNWTPAPGGAMLGEAHGRVARRRARHLAGALEDRRGAISRVGVD